MDAISIVHLGDLHFDKSRDQLEVWRSLRRFLNTEIRPQLILITGDIVNTPREDLYALARTELDQLQTFGSTTGITYKLCAGNHDRHPYGNAPGKFRKLWNRLRPGSAVEAWFDNQFAGVLVTADQASDIRLEGANPWTVRLVSCDSSSDAKYLAQGFASMRDLEALNNSAAKATQADIVIMLVHHHLLPVAELERTQQRLGGLFKPTIMLNAGSTLEALARNTVDIVLHGHEHQRAIARYGTFYGAGNQIAIVGAGSATGAKTLGGFEYTRASLNLIQLHNDRSVYLREIRHNSTNWEIMQGSEVLLLNSREIRRARFYRRNNPNSSPKSEVIKSIEFHENRDITITETYTDWAIEHGQWVKTTRNSSGWPSAARVEFHWGGGNPTVEEAEFSVDPSQDHSYLTQVTIDSSDLPKRRAFERIVVNFKWLGGAVLTENDLSQLSQTNRGPYRSQGQEFATIRAENELLSLSLLVRLPQRYAPKPSDVTAYYAGPDGKSTPSTEFTQGVQHHACGIFSLTVPYPIKEYQYTLSWPVADTVPVTAAAVNFRTKAASEATAKILLDALEKAASVGKGLSLAIYIPSEQADDLLIKRAEVLRGAMTISQLPPCQLSLSQANTLHRYAWWGETCQALADEDNRRKDVEAGFLLNERALMFVPILPPGCDDAIPWGLVRIGFHDHLSAEDLIRAREVFARALSYLLEAAERLDGAIPCVSSSLARRPEPLACPPEPPTIGPS